VVGLPLVIWKTFFFSNLGGFRSLSFSFGLRNSPGFGIGLDWIRVMFGMDSALVAFGDGMVKGIAGIH
jgi:hypothetical protein